LDVDSYGKALMTNSHFVSGLLKDYQDVVNAGKISVFLQWILWGFGAI
jgi:hypothetical protein